MKSNQVKHMAVPARVKTVKMSVAERFGDELAILLADKIAKVYKNFAKKDFCKEVRGAITGKNYTNRIDIIASALQKYLPKKYEDTLSILMQILGPENTEETGMFKHFYWLIPMGKFIEKYGLDNFSLSMKGIEEITKRSTGEYAIRPYARLYPQKTLTTCQRWAHSKNFHLRRLASEGLRPKLPWASRLEIWNNNPDSVFNILEILKEDEVMFVKRSVANHLRDWLKVNPKAAKKVISRWSKSKNIHTQWILKHAQRR